MTRRAGVLIRDGVVVLLLCVVTTGCGGAPAPPDEGAEMAGQPAVSAATGDRIDLVDDAGHAIRLASPPARIVSLVPSATEILLALGQEDRLVGRTDFDPQGELGHLPSVGGGLQPSVEALVDLRPDLVIRFSADSDPHTPRQLDAAGIPHLAIRPDGLSDIRRIIGLLGRATGREAAADSLRIALEGELAEVARQVEEVPRRRVAFLLGGDPPLVAGGGTFLHELIELAGGVNVFEDIGDLYAPISQEEVVRRAPELILILEGARLPPALATTPIRPVPLQIPGLEVGASARLIARILHPDRVP